MERLPHVLSEIRSLNQGASAALAAAAAPPPSAEERMGLALRPGARVFDLVTGQEGEVLAGTIAHYVVPSAER
jgi:hypothetical protein